MEDLTTSLSGSTGMRDSASLGGGESSCSCYRDHSKREKRLTVATIITWYLLTVTLRLENMQVNGAAGQGRMHSSVKRQLKTTKVIWSRFGDTNLTVTIDYNQSENIRGVQLHSRTELMWSELQQRQVFEGMFLCSVRIVLPGSVFYSLTAQKNIFLSLLNILDNYQLLWSYGAP